MEVQAYTSGNFRPTEYTLSSSFSASHIPIVCCNSDMNLLEGENSLFLYSKPGFKKSTTHSFKNTTNNILERLNYYIKLGRSVVSKAGGVELVLVFGKGYICTTEGQILLCLAIAKNKAIEFNQLSTSHFTNDDLVCYVATEFITDPQYKTFYRRLDKIYLSDAYTKGIEVRIMTSSRIEKITFANEFKLQYNNIGQLEHHLQHEVGKLLLRTDEDFRNFSPGLEIPPPSMEELMASSVDEARERRRFEAAISGPRFSERVKLKRTLSSNDFIPASVSSSSASLMQELLGQQGTPIIDSTSYQVSSASEYINVQMDNGYETLVPNPEYSPEALETQDEIDERLEAESADEPWAIVEAGVEDHNGQVHAIDSEVGRELLAALDIAENIPNPGTATMRETILGWEGEFTLTGENNLTLEVPITPRQAWGDESEIVFIDDENTLTSEEEESQELDPDDEELLDDGLPW